jgi:protein-tyrosine kinase
MSKLFELMKKAEGQLPDVDLPLIFADEDQVAKTPEPEQAKDATEAPAASENLDAPVFAAATGSQAGRLSAIRVSAAAPIFPFDRGPSRAANQYRVIRTKIVHDPRRPRLVVVSSPGSGDGKTVTAINVAGVLALKADLKVLLVDADFRRSSVSSVLGLAKTPGLGEVLAGTCELKDAIIEVQQLPNLHVLPSGAPTVNPSELLDSPQWRATAQILRNSYDFVIVDTVPAAAAADYELIQLVADAVLLVVRPDHTSRPVSIKAVENIPREKLLGVVVNCIPNSFLWKPHGDNYYYDYATTSA